MLQVMRFLREEDGPAAVEYAILLALLVGVMVAAITSVGFEIQQVSEDNVNAFEPALTPND